MKKQKGKDFVKALRELCLEYKISFSRLEKIVKKLKTDLIEEEESGETFWGGAAKFFKNLGKK
jgi:hypothetical protein